MSAVTELLADLAEERTRGVTALTTADRRKLDNALAPTFITTRAGAEPPKTSRPTRPVKREPTPRLCPSPTTPKRIQAAGR